MVLFCVCAYILVKHKETVQKTLLTFSVLMFSMASADMILTWHYIFRSVVRGEGVQSGNVYPKLVLFVTNKYVFPSPD